MPYIDQVRVKVGESPSVMYDVHSRATGLEGNITNISNIGEVVDSGISSSDVEQNIINEAGYSELYDTLGITTSEDTKLETVVDKLADRSVDQSSRIDSLEYEHFSINSFSASPASAEIGSTVSSVNLTWTIVTPSGTSLISNIIKSSGDADIDVLGRNNYPYSGTIKSTKTWTLSAKLNDLPAKTRNATITFMNKKYYGAKTIPSSYDSTFIHSLTGELDSDRKGNFTANAGANQYIFFSIPTSYGTPSFVTGGLSVELEKVGTNVQYLYDDGTSTTYDIYKTDQAGLGSTTYTVS